MKDIPIKTAVSLYGLSELDCHPMRGGYYAHVYSFQRDHKDYILRLSPPNNEIDEKAQKSILAWMACLAAHSASVPAPLPSQKNNLIETIPTADGIWLVVAFTRAEGILSEELPLDQWDGPLVQTLGKAVGKIHAIARVWKPPVEASYPEWDAGGNLFNEQIRDEHWLKDKQARLLERVHALSKPAEAYGLIHCDLHFANFYVDVPAQIITIIDFDDCAYGWFSMDIAILLFDILVLYPGTDKEEFGLKFLCNFLAGYLTENAMPMSWLEQIPLFLKLLEINIFDQVAKYYPNDAGEWSSKFMPGRKERIETDLPYVDLDFKSLSKRFA
jgi:Ser/Thr protein kinase RdoA (MazF antagonist)